MKDVVAALIRRRERFLICQRPANKARPLMWEFPGGKVEEGEAPERALIRECEEELGITLRVGPLYMAAEHRYPDIHIRLLLYEARVAAGRLRALEHADLRWITADEIPRFQFCPADRDILARLMRDAQGK